MPAPKPGAGAKGFDDGRQDLPSFTAQAPAGAGDKPTATSAGSPAKSPDGVGTAASRAYAASLLAWLRTQPYGADMEDVRLEPQPDGQFAVQVLTMFDGADDGDAVIDGVMQYYTTNPEVKFTEVTVLGLANRQVAFTVVKSN
ncbi:hypothetical protein [Streptodolium elevatio]